FNPDEATIAGLWFTGNNTDQSTFRIKGLTPGNYYLKEVKSPDGYALLTQDIEIVVHNDMKVTINSNNGYPKTTGSAEGEISQIETEPIPVYSFDVKNESYELPETGGGYGYPHYLLMGMMLMALPAGYIISRKKRIF
ncbi:MAG: LPXTG cell wall anchor domain-containing protein, partial [Ileibacterium sp.]|nr:LPXTG cell wall anchor domain-containing protein [Ileibacterium sp.]